MRVIIGHTILGFWFVYYHTVGRVVSEVQYRRATRKSDQAWREFMKKYQ